MHAFTRLSHLVLVSCTKPNSDSCPAMGLRGYIRHLVLHSYALLSHSTVWSKILTEGIVDALFYPLTREVVMSEDEVSIAHIE